MCEASAYLIREGNEELVLEGVERLEVQGDTVTLKNLFGESRTLRAAVKQLSLVDHRIILEPQGEVS